MDQSERTADGHGIEVFDVQRMSVHDGPGIRTTFFLKGCGLRCKWCHNPEGGAPGVQLRFTAGKCVLCGRCGDVCPVRAHEFRGGAHRILRDRCVLCGKCADVCAAEALALCGDFMTPKQAAVEARKDAAFYREKGGVTFSGGEPTLQAEGLIACARAMRESGLRVAIDTCGDAPFSVFEALMPLTQVFLYDLKCADGALHAAWTGKRNERILDNVSRLSARGATLWIRVPVIREFNGNAREMTALRDIVARLSGVERITLIPYHRLGLDKYEQFGLTPRYEGVRPDADTMRGFVSLFAASGLPVDPCGD